MIAHVAIGQTKGVRKETCLVTQPPSHIVLNSMEDNIRCIQLKILVLCVLTVSDTIRGR